MFRYLKNRLAERSTHASLGLIVGALAPVAISLLVPPPYQATATQLLVALGVVGAATPTPGGRS